MADLVLGSAEWAARYGASPNGPARWMLEIPLGPTRIPNPPAFQLANPNLVFGATPAMQLNATDYTITALEAGGFIVIVNSDTEEAAAFSTFDEAVEELRKRRAVDVEDAAEAERQAQAVEAYGNEVNRLRAEAAERERTARHDYDDNLAEAKALREQEQAAKVEDFLPAKA